MIRLETVKRVNMLVIRKLNLTQMKNSHKQLAVELEHISLISRYSLENLSLRLEGLVGVTAARPKLVRTLIAERSHFDFNLCDSVRV